MERIFWTSHLSGYVNSQNNRVWSAANPSEIKDTPVHDQKVGVWRAISRNLIIGPIFFDDTINSEWYTVKWFFIRSLDI
jgi:hypothetical protein